MRILVQKSPRPRRWAGVALFAALALTGVWMDQGKLKTVNSAWAASSGMTFEESLEPVDTLPGGRLALIGSSDMAFDASLRAAAAAAAAQSAQFTGLAASNSVSTAGGTPSK